MKYVFIAIAVNSVAPLLFLFVSPIALGHLPEQVETIGLDHIASACQSGAIDTRSICRDLALFRTLSVTAWLLLIAGVSLPLLNYALPGWVTSNEHRARLARVIVRFSKAFSIALLVAGLLLLTVLGHFFAIRLGASQAMPLLPFGYYVASAAIILITGVRGANALIGAGRPIRPPRVRAMEASEADGPVLYSLVSEAAGKLGIDPPRVVTGPEPNLFFIDSQLTLRPSGETMTGRTVYLPLPLVTLLPREEMVALIARTLAPECIDGDTSQRQFLALHKRLGHSIAELQRIEPALAFPLSVNLLVLQSRLGESADRLHRQRALRADQLAAERVSAGVLGRGIVLAGVLQQHWGRLTSHAGAALSHGVTLRDPITMLLHYSQFDKGRIDLALLDRQTRAGADNLDARLRAFAGPEWTFTVSAEVFADGVRKALAAYSRHEGLSALFADYCAARTGRRIAGPNDERPRQIRETMRGVYEWLAPLVRAEGKIDPATLNELENLASQAFAHFNPLEFRLVLLGLAAEPVREPEVARAALPDTHRKILDRLTESFAGRAGEAETH